MYLMAIKYKNSYPNQAKSRIVVLGNEKYAPVLSQVQFHTLLSIAIQHKQVLHQGFIKNAFCHGVLPDDECVVVHPPKGCPHSSPNKLWRLKKILYGLDCSPLHWFNHIRARFKSIGLHNSPNHPCVFQGKLLPEHPPLYVGLFVDDFCFFREIREIVQISRISNS